MDRVERDKLYLIWLSCKDISSINTEENLKRFKYVWRRIMTQMEPYFKACSPTLDSIFKTFKRIHVTVDPNQPCGYDPQKDALVFNILSLLFSPIQDQYCVPSPPFKTGGQFVHEFDHYRYFREHSMLGRTKEEYDKFDKTKLGELEKRAFLSQISFFEKCKESVPQDLNSYTIRIRKWSKNGKPIESKLQEFVLDREKSLSIIDSMISELRQVVDRIDEGQEYNKMCEENTINDMRRIAELLSLPIKLDLSKRDYRATVIEI